MEYKLKVNAVDKIVTLLHDWSTRLDNNGFAVLFSEVPTNYTSVKVFVFYLGGFYG